MKIPKHIALTDRELALMDDLSPLEFKQLKLSYAALREHHALEVGELARRLTRALQLANGYLTDIEGEDPRAYDYQSERDVLDSLLPPGVARPQQGVFAPPHDAPRQPPSKDQ